MPQWDFLAFLLKEAERFPNFRLMLQAEVTDLLARKDRISGVLVETPDDVFQINAGLTIGADGRHSTVRAKSNLKVREFGAPFDVLWMRLPFQKGDPEQPVARFQGGDFFIMLYRGDYWQCALVIPKGAYNAMKAEGITGFRARLRTVAGFARDRVETIQSFDDVKVLDVRVDRMDRVGAARTRVHRRRGACDVAGRRRRYQSRDPGRGRDSQYPCARCSRNARRNSRT